jgi:hypothetical protein
MGIEVVSMIGYYEYFCYVYCEQVLKYNLKIETETY